MPEGDVCMTALGVGDWKGETSTTAQLLRLLTESLRSPGISPEPVNVEANALLARDPAEFARIAAALTAKEASP